MPAMFNSSLILNATEFPVTYCNVIKLRTYLCSSRRSAEQSRKIKLLFWLWTLTTKQQFSYSVIAQAFTTVAYILQEVTTVTYRKWHILQ